MASRRDRYERRQAAIACAVTMPKFGDTGPLTAALNKAYESAAELADFAEDKNSEMIVVERVMRPLQDIMVVVRKMK